MTQCVKSGREQLDDFFADIEGIDGVDVATAHVVQRLYEEGKLTPTNIANELGAMLEDGSEATEG